MRLSLPRAMSIDVQARLKSTDSAWRAMTGLRDDPVISHGALAVKNGRLINAFCAFWGSNLAPQPFSSKVDKSHFLFLFFYYFIIQMCRFTLIPGTKHLLLGKC